jgi:hypothetical protein
LDPTLHLQEDPAAGNYPPREKRGRGRQWRRTSSRRPAEREHRPAELVAEGAPYRTPSVARWSSAAIRDCRSKYASPQIWLAAPAFVPLLHGRAALALGDGVGPTVSASGGAVEGDGEQLEAGTSAERSQRRGDAASVVLGEPPRRPYPRRGRPPGSRI